MNKLLFRNVAQLGQEKIISNLNLYFFNKLIWGGGGRVVGRGGKGRRAVFEMGERKKRKKAGIQIFHQTGDLSAFVCLSVTAYLSTVWVFSMVGVPALCLFT